MIHKMDGLDVEIQRLELFIDRAADSLLTFYDAANAGFLRSTLTVSDKASATSSARSVFALAEYVRFLQERAAGTDGALLERMSGALRSSFAAWVTGLADPQRQQQIRSASENDRNHFTDSHLLLALSMTQRLASVSRQGRDVPSVSPPGCDVASVHQAGRDLQQGLITHLDTNKGGKIHNTDRPTHDFITLHALRAVDAFATVDEQQASVAPHIRELIDKLGPRVEHDVLACLGYHSAGVEAEFDPAELLFTAALLERCRTPSWEKLLHRAVEVVVDDQTEDGAWVGSRVVAYDKRGLLHVASYEVGLTLTFLAASAIRRGDHELLERVLPSLQRVCGLAHASFQSVGDFRGWANDRTKWPGLIEGWATAIVLTLLLRYREVLLDCRQERVLGNYRCEYPEPTGNQLAWPDLQRTLRIPGPAEGTILGKVSDPSPNGELVAALRGKIVDPILKDPAERPEKAGLILYGTPGTRKTTMVTQIAKALRWPMITLSPPDFLSDGGLEGFEAAAARVFTDLKRLKRVVILFDECEDFFRPRPGAPGDDGSDSGKERDSGDTPSSEAKKQTNAESAPPERAPQAVSASREDTSQSAAPDTRTIGAFITAGMLPRLQDLRDARWNVFVLATNVRLEELDSAAIRPGRFDFAQDVVNPTVAAQVRYVEKLHPKRHRKLEPEETELLVEAVEAVDRSMPFRAIDDVAEALVQGEVAADAGEVTKLIACERRRKKPPPLYA